MHVCQHLVRSGSRSRAAVRGEPELPSPFSSSSYLLRAHLSGVGAQAVSLPFESQRSRQLPGSIGELEVWRRGVWQPPKSQPIRGCFLAANERTCWEGHTHWYHVGRNYVDQWRLEVDFFFIFFSENGEVELRFPIVIYSAESWNALFHNLKLVYMLVCEESLPHWKFWDANL